MSIVPQQIGRYELQEQLGRGSAGEVWKGHNPLVHQDVAIKLLYPDLQSDPNFMTRLAQQGKALTALHYPNLVRVREVNISRPSEGNETTAYIVMDYVEGQTLTDYINTTSHKGIFPTPEQIVYLFTALGIAIDYGHQRGFMHGNIKPGNILLAKYNKKHFDGGEPQLSDFGIAQVLGSAAGISSPHYMSPEQAKGHPISSKSDIYSLGVILYEICTGVQPFRDESSVAVMMQHISILPTPPSLINANIPIKLSEVILRAMSKDPDARYSKASLLASAIADACSLQSKLQLFRRESRARYRGGSIPQKRKYRLNSWCVATFAKNTSTCAHLTTIAQSFRPTYRCFRQISNNPDQPANARTSALYNGTRAFRQIAGCTGC